MTDRPWPPAAATGVGSLPGTDPVEAARLVLGEVPDLPYIPELPARGLGADMVGRTASLLIDLPVEWLTRGWTMTSSPGHDLRVARDHLRWDVDAITELGAGVEVLKLQVTGPVTLASSIELPLLHKVITDHGARADLTASLAEGVAQHVAEVASRMPGTRIVLQVDEPLMPAALGGRIPTPSGYGSARALAIPEASDSLQAVLDAAVAAGAVGTVVHCCAADAPLGLFAGAGADAVAVDLTQVGSDQWDVLGELVDSGTVLFAGVVPALDPGRALVAERAADALLELWRRLGFGPASVPDSVVVTPACGMAGASEAYARQVMARLRDITHILQDASVA